MVTRVDDPGIGSRLVALGYHEKIASREIRRRLGPGMHVIDLGANIGYFALMEARQVGPGGVVHAIEPVPDNYALLVQNVELNALGGIVRTYPVGIGERSGTGRMCLSSFMSRHRLAVGDTGHDGPVIEVPMLSFGDFLDRHGIGAERIDFLRMDCEGYEAKLLPELLERLRPSEDLQLNIEFHPRYIAEIPGCSFRDTLRLLDHHQMRFAWLLDHDGRRKIVRRDLEITEILGSSRLMNATSVESWLVRSPGGVADTVPVKD
jgi:FkbM family methyltransferase